MFNAGFELLGTAPVLQPLADLAMHVFEQPKQRANTGFLPYNSCVRVLIGQVVLHAKRSNALLHISLVLRWAATGHVSIAIPKCRQNFEVYSSSHKIDENWKRAERYGSRQMDA